MVSRKDSVGKLEAAKLSHDEFTLLSNPAFWHSKATELHRAAMLLAQQFISDMKALERSVDLHKAGQLAEIPPPPTSTFNQFFLLSAFALENLFKGLVLYSEPSLINGGKTTGILRSHDLLSLAARADVVLGEEEHRFCVLASNAAVYWGRYPVSNSADAFVRSRALGEQAIPIYEQLFHGVALLYAERFHGRTRASLGGA